MNGFTNYYPEELLTPEQFSSLRYDARKLFASVMNNLHNFGETSTRKHAGTLRKRLRLTPAGLERAEVQLVEQGLLRVERDGEHRIYSRI